MTSAELARPSRKQRVRTLWISDVHLGTRDCQAEHLSQFLKGYHADRIYLVGDILDGWRLRKGWHWPQSHNDVIQKILRKSRKGTRVVYIPGNHDDLLGKFYGAYGNITIQKHAIHKLADALEKEPDMLIKGRGRGGLDHDESPRLAVSGRRRENRVP